MPNYIQTNSTMANKVDEKLREELWEELSTIGESTAHLAGTLNSIKKYKEFSDSLKDKPDVVEQAKETVFMTFAGSDRYLSESFQNNGFEFTPDMLDHLVRTLSVTKNGRESSYQDTYGIPKVTEENFDAIAVQLALNITNGDLAKNFDKSGPEKVSLSMHKHPMSAGFNKEQPLDVQPFAKQVKREETKAAPVEKPKKPGFFTNALGKFQRLIHIKGKARDAVETYEKQLAEWKRYDESVNQVNMNADRINSGRQNKRNEISAENIKEADQAYRSAQKKTEKSMGSFEYAEMQRKAHSQFQELYSETSLSVNNLKKVKLSDAAVEQIRNNIRTMDGLLEKVPVKKEAQNSLDGLKEQFSDNMKQQQILRGKVKDTSSGRLEEKLGVNSKQTETHTRSRTNNKTNELERQNSMV